MGDIIEKVSMPLEPAMFFVSILDQSLNTS
jgi:hypothetical protein